jgi:phosphatidylglycerol---prolipoprotein diacylglyceryl transferase
MYENFWPVPGGEALFFRVHSMRFGRFHTMIPYVFVSSVDAGPVHIRIFSGLVTAAVIIGFAIATGRARRYGISRESMARVSVFIILAGALGAILFKLLYLPEAMAHGLRDPRWLLTHLQGIASFGGFFGGLAGAFLAFHFSRYDSATRLRFLDSVGFSLPFAWAIGRAGCALVHDHPGVRSDSWLAVAYPGGGRFDLGVLECLFLSALSLVFALLARRPWPTGFFFSLFFAAYGPFRLVMDQLHVDPPRYFRWSVDQYCAVLSLIIAAYSAWFIVNEPRCEQSSGGSSCLPASAHG